MPRGEAYSYLQEIKKGGTNIDHFDSRSIPELNMGLGAEKGGGGGITQSVFFARQRHGLRHLTFEP